MKILKYNILLVILFILSSCQNNDIINYDDINDFILSNNVELKNLSHTTINLNDIYQDFDKKDIAIYNFGIKNSVYNLDISKIAVKDNTSNYESKISPLVLSKNKQNALIAIEIVKGNSSNIDIKRTYYILKKINGHWKISTKAEVITVS